MRRWMLFLNFELRRNINSDAALSSAVFIGSSLTLMAILSFVFNSIAAGGLSVLMGFFVCILWLVLGAVLLWLSTRFSELEVVS